MPFVGFYTTAKCAAIGVGIAAAGFWLCSDYLVARRLRLGNRAVRRDRERLAIGWRNYRLIEWIPVSVIAVCVLVMLGWISAIQWDRESSSVNQALAIQYTVSTNGDPALSSFSVSNGTNEQLADRHRWLCRFRDVVYRQHAVVEGVWAFRSDRQKSWMMWGGSDEPPPESDIEKTFVIESKGDADSTSCLRGLAFATPVVCADVEVWFQYYLADYPKRLQVSKTRIVTTPSGEHYEWRKVAFHDPTDYCAEYSRRQ